MPKKRILITGGGGLLGANLTRYYVERGYKVFLLVEHTPELWRIQDILSSITVYPADVRDFSAVKSVFFQANPDIIFHCAGYGRFTFQSNQAHMYEVNFLGTVNVLNAAKETGFECFINTGSWQEYGIHHGAVTETSLLNPITDFGVSKAAATQFCLKEAYERDLPIYTVRPFFMYGNYELYARLVTSLLLGGIKKEKVCISSPQRRYDFIHVLDVVDLYAAIERLRPRNQLIFNAASGVDYSVKDLVTKMHDLFGSDFQYCWGDKKPVFDEYAQCLASIEHIKKGFGWEANFSLDKGLLIYKEWLEQNLFLHNRSMSNRVEEAISMI